MKTVIKQPILWLGLGILIVVLALVSGSFDKKINAIADTPQIPQTSPTASSDSQPIVEKQIIGHEQETEHVHAVDRHSQVDTNDNMPRHEDMLSEDMKQSIRDKLLFHGPMEVINHPDGSVELPANGRFTQMPVAVEMPDGSIQIKEYSSLPE